MPTPPVYYPSPTTNGDFQLIARERHLSASELRQLEASEQKTKIIEYSWDTDAVFPSVVSISAQTEPIFDATTTTSYDNFPGGLKCVVTGVHVSTNNDDTVIGIASIDSVATLGNIGYAFLNRAVSKNNPIDFYSPKGLFVFDSPQDNGGYHPYVIHFGSDPRSGSANFTTNLKLTYSFVRAID